MRIRKYGLKYQRIDRIFISHLHGDHYFGLVGLLSTMHLLGRIRSIDIYGPVGLKAIVDLQLHAAGSRLAYDIHIHEIAPKSKQVLYEDEKVSVECFPLLHKIPTSGFLIRQKERERSLLAKKAQSDGVKIEYFHRLKKGEDITTKEGVEFRSVDYTSAPPKPKSYAYCSDTAFSEEVAIAVNEVDALYHEATFLKAHEDRAHATKHSTAEEAARIAQKANVGRLLMGHLSARYDDGEAHMEEAKFVFSKSRYMADGDEIILE